MTTQPEFIEVAQACPPTVQAPSGDPIAAMLQAIVSQGVTTESVGALEKLADLYERMQLRDAEKQFNAAFVALQGELPVIVASTEIPNRGRYERFEDVMRVVSPLLAKHGFSVAFSQDTKENRIVETCTLRHVAGYSQQNSFAVRVGGKADSETQADCKASTTAKRNALLNALNIVIRQDAFQDEDSDASILGAFISPEKALYLRELVKSTKSDEAAFLKFAQAESYETITESSYDRLAAALHKKQRA